MQKLISDLISIGISPKLFSLISDESIVIHPNSYLGAKILGTSQNGVGKSDYSQLQALGAAINDSLLSKHRAWVIAQLREMAREIKNNSDQISVISRNAAELIASGLLAEVFDDLKPLVECKKTKTPDLLIGLNKYVEIYCPQCSQPDKEKVESELKKQCGMVRMVFSYPVTGSDGKALIYPANKTIDRVLNHKWKNDQTKPDAVNILWLDLINGLEFSSAQVAPYQSLNHAEQTYIFSTGIWHAFYGEKSKSRFVSDRFVLKFGASHSKFYYQTRDGIFRSRNSLSAALLLTRDGIILFENPWASNPLDENTRKSIASIYKFRPDYSYFSGGKPLDANDIDGVLSQIEWLFEKN